MKATLEAIQVLKLIQRLQSNEEMQTVIDGIANHLAEAYEQSDDDALRNAVDFLRDASEALNHRGGR